MVHRLPLEESLPAIPGLSSSMILLLGLLSTSSLKLEQACLQWESVTLDPW